MDGETKNEGSDEGFTDTEKWAQEVLERAKNRSEGSFDTENTPLEDDSKSKIKDVDELEVSQIHDQAEESFRGSIVTLEDIEGEQPITPCLWTLMKKVQIAKMIFFPLWLRGLVSL